MKDNTIERRGFLKYAATATVATGLLGRPIAAQAGQRSAKLRKALQFGMLPRNLSNAEKFKLAKECGFEMALSTAWGTATASSDVFQLPRIAPWDRGAFKFAARMVRAYAQREFDVVRRQVDRPGGSGPPPSC